MKKIFCLFFAVIFGSVLSAYAERVLVVGDSITAQSNQAWGYTPLIRKALSDAGVTNVEFVPLGWSGQTISGWIPVVKDSYTNENLHGDVAQILFKQEFDKGADTVLIFLGMNDALCPRIVPTEEGFAQWKTDYCTLIDSLRARVPSFKRLLLCPPTMLTENPYSFKNQMMDRMAEIMKEAAQEKNAEILDLRGELRRFFLNARLQNNAFHVTPDCVHPQADGHKVMAWTILKAIGQNQAADLVYAQLPEWLRDFNAPGISLFVLNSSEPGKMQFRGFIRGAEKSALEVVCPEGWKLDGITNLPGDEFEISLSGHNPALTSVLTIKAGEITRTIKMNAPFYVASGFDGVPFQGGDSYKPEETRTEIDAQILAGKNPLETIFEGKPVEWLVYYPQADVTGYDLPNAIDFASVHNGQPFQTAYMVRKVSSPKAQKVLLKINALSFSTMAYPTIYVNGVQVYEDCVSPRHKTSHDQVEIELKEGENVLSARVGHFMWQWAVEFALEGEGLEY